MRPRYLSVLTPLFCALALSACATSQLAQTDTDNEAITAAQQQVVSATRNPGIDEYAAIDLQKAREHLQSARVAWSQGDRLRAEQQAYVARRLAQIAMVKVEIGKARAHAVQIQALRRSSTPRLGD